MLVHDKTIVEEPTVPEPIEVGLIAAIYTARKSMIVRVIVVEHKMVSLSAESLLAVRY